MKYEVVSLDKKTVAGLSVRTANADPDMMNKAGSLWQDFYAGAMAEIPHVTSGVTYGLYHNYESDVTGSYDMLACVEVSSIDRLPQRFAGAVIPAGKYAKFSFCGSALKDLGRFWQEVWNTELTRSYTGDFEEYLPGEDMDHMQINIYIALAQ